MRRNFFLDHPVFSIVVSIVIFIIGLIGLLMLPVDQYPQIVPPVVRITASYPGADAMTVTQAVATPIEQELNGTPGMIYMSSSSSNSGGFSALVTFDIDVDPELAAVDIQNRIKKAEARLPAEVVQNGISVSKETASRLLTITVMSDDPKFDEVYLSNYTTLNVIDPIRRIPGVGSVSNVGSRYYAMQIWVEPDKLANLGLTVKDVQNALKDQNRESAAGTLGQAPMTDIDVTMPIIARGRLSTVEDFEDIVLRAGNDGSMIRLRDVARISLEASSYATESGINGGNAAVININMLPGSNAMEVAEAVKREMETIARNFPEGITYEIPFDMTTYIEQSIHHVYRTFFEALLLVIAVVFLSLQDWRATLIPVIAVPISLVGTFGVMLIFGFSLNMLTLLGLILAIGIVVDDAIVVVENVDRIMNAEKIPAAEATAKAMKNLGSALIAMSLVLCAVFVPVSFLPGITGQLYRQFTVTIGDVRQAAAAIAWPQGEDIPPHQSVALAWQPLLRARHSPHSVASEAHVCCLRAGACVYLRDERADAPQLHVAGRSGIFQRGARTARGRHDRAHPRGDREGHGLSAGGSRRGICAQRHRILAARRLQPGPLAADGNTQAVGRA